MADEKSQQGKRRSRVQIARDRRRISDLYLQQRKTQEEIAQELELSQSTVSRDLQALIGEWKKSSLMDVDDAIAEELAKVNMLELEYWAAWKESKKRAGWRTIKRKSVQDDDGAKAPGYEVERISRFEDRVGDPRYLAGVQWCVEQRRAILGLDAPIKRDTEFNFEEWKQKRAERLKEVQEIKPVSVESDVEQ